MNPELLVLHTNDGSVSAPTWDAVQQAIGNLAMSPDAFLVLESKSSTSEVLFVQAAVDRIPQKGPWFRKTLRESGMYLVEVRLRRPNAASDVYIKPPLVAFRRGRTVKKIQEAYSSTIHRCRRTLAVAEVGQIFLTYYNEGTAPDISDWEPVSF